MELIKETSKGIASAAMPYLFLGGVIVVLYVFRGNIANWISGAAAGAIIEPIRDTLDETKKFAINWLDQPDVTGQPTKTFVSSITGQATPLSKYTTAEYKADWEGLIEDTKKWREKNWQNLTTWEGWPL